MNTDLIHSADADEQVAPQTRKFREMVAAAIETTRAKASPKQAELHSIADELARVRDSGLSYATLRPLIEESFGIVVSEQTLRQFCQQELGFSPRKGKRRRGKGGRVQG